MIDIFTLALTHGLIALAAWRLLTRDDLDEEGETAKRMRPGGAAANRAKGPAGKPSDA